MKSLKNLTALLIRLIQLNQPRIPPGAGAPGSSTRDVPPAGDRLHPALLRSYADHRIAAFAALIGLGVPGTELDDVECTSKTLPDFPALWAGLLGREPSRGLDQSGVPR